MIYKFAALHFAFALSVVWANFSSAQTTLPTQEEELRSLSIYGANLAEITPEIEETVANWANPIILILPEGQTPREAALEACPNASDGYISVFENLSAGWNPHIIGGVDIDAPGITDQFVLAPNCIQHHSQRVTIADGQSIEGSLYSDYTAALGSSETDARIEGSDFSESVAILNNRNVGSLNRIRPNDQLLVPLPRADFVTSPEGAKAISEALKKNAKDWSVGIETEFRIEIGGALSTVTAAGSDDAAPGSCDGQNESDLLKSHAISFSKDYEAIFWNLAKARDMHGSNAKKSKVAIFDTGLPRTDWWQKQEFVKTTKPAVPDTLYLPVELWPENYENFLSFWKTVNEDELTPEVLKRAQHTETVLGASMGGYYGYLFNTSFGVIEPRVFSIFDVEAITLTFPPRLFFSPRSTKIEEAIQSVKEIADNVIVNISAGTPNDSGNGINKALRRASSDTNNKDLYIVAAGNNGENPDKDQSNLFPAFYGGQNAAGLPFITVGGHQGSLEKEVWEGSNRGTHVDILAPSCGVQTIKFEPNATRNIVSLAHDQGTSLAAPRVTFTAAVILHLMQHSPKFPGSGAVAMKIKNRLLSSSDLNFGFRDDVVDGRVLNLVKAVNIFSDVVEFSPGHIVRGDITFQSGVSDISICRETYRVKPRQIQKISKWDNPAAGDKYKFYFTKTKNGELFSCTDYRVPNLQFKPFAIDGLEAEPDTLDEFQDIVFKMENI